MKRLNTHNIYNITITKKIRVADKNDNPFQFRKLKKLIFCRFKTDKNGKTGNFVKLRPTKIVKSVVLSS